MTGPGPVTGPSVSGTGKWHDPPVAAAPRAGRRQANPLPGPALRPTSPPPPPLPQLGRLQPPSPRGRHSCSLPRACADRADRPPQTRSRAVVPGSAGRRCGDSACAVRGIAARTLHGCRASAACSLEYRPRLLWGDPACRRRLDPSALTPQ